MDLPLVACLAFNMLEYIINWKVLLRKVILAFRNTVCPKSLVSFLTLLSAIYSIFRIKGL